MDAPIDVPGRAAPVAIVHIDHAILLGERLNLLPPDQPRIAQPRDEHEWATHTVFVIKDTVRSNFCKRDVLSSNQAA